MELKISFATKKNFIQWSVYDCEIYHDDNFLSNFVVFSAFFRNNNIGKLYLYFLQNIILWKFYKTAWYW